MSKQENTEVPRISLAEQANTTGTAIHKLITGLKQQRPQVNPAFLPYFIKLERFIPNPNARRHRISEYDKGESLDDLGGVSVEIGGVQMEEDMKLTLYEKPDRTPAVIEISQGDGGKKRIKHLIWDPHSQLWTPEINGHRSGEKPGASSELFETAVEIAKEIDEFL